MGRASGKIAIVTGSARGMGAEFAHQLVREGARVVLTDLLEAEGQATAAALGENALFLRHDVTQESEWKRVVAETEKAFGAVSVLVNNAAIMAWGPLETMTEQEYRRVIGINQVSVFLGMKSVIPSMKRAGSGSIVNISSVAGIVGTMQTMAYTAAKFAVRGMTKSAAIELAPFNIRVNSVHPGFIDTPMTAPMSDNESSASIAATPMGRKGRPDEVASVVLMLATDEARFATGAEFVVDGGWTAQ